MLYVLFALSLIGVTVTDAKPDDHKMHDDIVDVAVAAGGFHTLVAALQAADLVGTLKGDGPFTVFAPSDEAFSKLPSGTVERLLRPENKADLVALLTFHVVSGRIEAKDLLRTGSARTVNGRSLPLGLRIGEATVIKADVAASNGVIHVIDTVLIPPSSVSGRDAAGDQQAARTLIRRAIDRGAPLYNAGQAEACASVYEVTALALLQLDTDLPTTAANPIRRALDRIKSSHDSSERAWILREGLDEAYTALAPRRMMSAAPSGH